MRNQLSYPLAHTEMDPVREFWGDFKFDNDKVMLRLGKQQIVWGNTEGVKMLDIICPTDYRTFTQEPWEESRIAIWAMKLEYFFTQDKTLQFIFDPDVEPNFSAPAFSPYQLEISRLSNGAVKDQIERYINQTEPRSFSKSNFGFRWKQVMGDFEYTLNYWNAWTPFPGIWFGGIEPNSKSPLGYTILLDEQYRRRQALGGSFSKTVNKIGPLENFVLRGETVLFLKDIGTTHVPGNPPGVGLGQNRFNDLNYALCLDKSWYPLFAPRGLNFEFQYFQTINFNYHMKDLTFVNPITAGPMDQYENSASIYLWTDYLHETIQPEVLFVYETNHSDGYVRPKISYQISDHWKISLIANVYWGNKYTTWGQFNYNDEIGMQLKYGF